MNIYIINASILLSYFLILYVMIIYMYRKKHIPKTLPHLSVIVPAYNMEGSIKKTIESLYKVYDKKKMELIVINDCSKDNTLEILKELKRKYGFRLINNKKNMGKVVSVNHAAEYAKNNLILFLDADSQIKKEEIEEIVARLENPKVALVTCMCSPSEGNFTSRLQSIEFGMNHAVGNALSPFSSIRGIMGGCLAVKKNIFMKVGKFNYWAITEDNELSYRIREAGYRAEICRQVISNSVLKEVYPIFRQRVRWNAGVTQAMLSHFKSFITHPINLFFNILYIAMGILGLMITIKNYSYFAGFFQVLGNQISQTSLIEAFLIANEANNFIIFRFLGYLAIYPLFLIPFLAINDKKLKENPFRFLIVYPYVIIYLPLLSIPLAIGAIKGIYKFITLDKNKRGW